VYQNTTGVTPSTGDAPFLKVTGNTVTVAGLAVSTTYYVWVRNVDFSGNASGFSSAGTFTTTAGASIADGSVTTAKIVDSAVVAAKVAAGAIETAKIADGAATEAKIATSAITTTKISDLAISTPKLAAGAVTAAKITAGTITATEIAASTITGAKIAANTITAGNIAALTITASEIAASTITGAKIAALTIEAGNIAAATITGAKIAAGTIEAGNIAASTITGDKISATFTTTSNLVLTTAGKLYTSGKTSAASTTAGVFLGHDGGGTPGNYDFAVGDGTKSIVWDGSAGTFTITNVNISTNGQLISTGSAASSGGNGAVVGAPTNTGVFGVVGVATSGHTVPALGGYSTSTNTAAVGVLGQTTVNGIAALEGLAGGGDAGGIAAKLWGNIVVGGATNTGIFNLVLKEGTVGSRLDNQMQIYGALSTDADTTLGIVSEQGVASGTGAFAGILQIRIVWNGTEYWLPLQAV
jgi:hypothetical protein